MKNQICRSNGSPEGGDWGDCSSSKIYEIFSFNVGSEFNEFMKDEKNESEKHKKL